MKPRIERVAEARKRLERAALEWGEATDGTWNEDRENRAHARVLRAAVFYHRAARPRFGSAP